MMIVMIMILILVAYALRSILNVISYFCCALDRHRKSLVLALLQSLHNVKNKVSSQLSNLYDDIPLCFIVCSSPVYQYLHSTVHGSRYESLQGLRFLALLDDYVNKAVVLFGVGSELMLMSVWLWLCP
eukprot:scaffold38771_cov38-Prasinocladus_malaysianus.AAC.1